jgi:uncharacterized protein YjiS (DUF1127 family)
MQVHTDVSLVGTHVSFINKDGKEFGSWKPPESHGEIRKCLLEEGNAFCHGSVMIRKACLEDVGFYREAFEYTQDYDLWLRISEKYRVENIPDIFYQFRRGPKTISRKKLSRQLDFHLLAVALAKERERNGRDSLDEISTKNIEDILVTRYQIPPAQIRKFKDTLFLRYITESVKTLDRLDAIRMWWQMFRQEPRRWKIRILLEKILDQREKRLNGS